MGISRFNLEKDMFDMGRVELSIARDMPDMGMVDPAGLSTDTRLSREEGRIDVLMLSGGEPTLHPRLLDLLDAGARETILVTASAPGWPP